MSIKHIVFFPGHHHSPFLIFILNPLFYNVFVHLSESLQKKKCMNNYAETKCVYSVKLA